MTLPDHVMRNEGADAFLTALAEADPRRDEPSNEMVRELVMWAAFDLWWTMRGEP